MLPKLIQPVGPSVGAPRDAALVRYWLANTKDARHQPYWAGAIDGRVNAQLATAITRFQGDQIKGNPGVAGQIQPHGPTFQALERAVPRNIHDVKVVKDTAQLFMPPRPSDVAAFVSARGQTTRDTDPVALALRALAEELLTRHGLLVEIVATDIEGAARTIGFGFKGLRWIDNRGQIQSASSPTDPRVPAPFFALFETVARKQNEIDPVAAGRPLGRWESGQGPAHHPGPDLRPQGSG